MVEVVVAMGVFAVLLVGLASAIAVSRQAVPDGKRGPSATLAAGTTVEQIVADLVYATAVSTARSNELVLTVADRNGDGNPETIRYSWSGTAGDPLLRQFNGGAAAAVANDVREFELVYTTRQVQLPATSSESAERLLRSYGGILNFGNFTVTQNNWCGESFLPDLPSGVTSWRVTRVGFIARPNGETTGTFKVQIRSAEGGLPTANVLGEVAIFESTLDTGYAWKEVTFNNVSGLVPGARVALTIAGAADQNCCDILYSSLLATAANANFVKTTNQGSDWSAPAGQDAPFYVYGTVTTPNPATYQNVLSSVRTTIRSGSDAASRVSTTVRLLNQPPAPSS